MYFLLTVQTSFATRELMLISRTSSAEATDLLGWRSLSALLPIYLILQLLFYACCWDLRSNSTYCITTNHNILFSPCILVLEKFVRGVTQVLWSTLNTAHHDKLVNVKCDRRDMRLNLLCKVYEVMITVIFLLFNVSYLLIYWSIYRCIHSIYFIWHEQTGIVCVRKNNNTCETLKSYPYWKLFYVCCEINFICELK